MTLSRAVRLEIIGKIGVMGSEDIGPVSPYTPKELEFLARPVQDLNLDIWTVGVLLNNNIIYIYQLIEKSERMLSFTHNFSDKNNEKINKKLKALAAKKCGEQKASELLDARGKKCAFYWLDKPSPSLESLEVSPTIVNKLIPEARTLYGLVIYNNGDESFQAVSLDIQRDHPGSLTLDEKQQLNAVLLKYKLPLEKNLAQLTLDRQMQDGISLILNEKASFKHIDDPMQVGDRLLPSGIIIYFKSEQEAYDFKQGVNASMETIVSRIPILRRDGSYGCPTQDINSNLERTGVKSPGFGIYISDTALEQFSTGAAKGWIGRTAEQSGAKTQPSR